MSVDAVYESRLMKARSHLPVRPLHDIIELAKSTAVTIPIEAHTFGESPYQDLVAICAIVCRLKPRRAFEFGTFTGSTTRAMILNAPASTEVWTLDLTDQQRAAAVGLNAWNRTVDESVIGMSFHGKAEATRIHQIMGNSLDLDTRRFRSKIDVVFIDASHGYRYVLSDTAKAFEMLSPGGVILWHDYPTFPGVRRVLEELPAECTPVRIHGTTTAVFCQSKPVRSRRP